MSIKSPKPIIQALVLADHVYKDGSTGKHVIAGTFNTLVSIKTLAGSRGSTGPLSQKEEALLSNHPPFHQAGSPWFYLNLTEVIGEIELDLRYVSLKDERLYFEAKVKLKSNDPNLSCEASSAMPSLPREPGVYALEVLYDNEILGSVRVFVQEVVSNGND